jgi:putative NADH-flavin reductase
MKIALFGATGRTGRHILDYALADGHRVTVLARNPSKLPPGKYSLTIQLGHVLDASAVDDAVFGQDAVISALGLGNSPQPDAFSRGVANIVTAMQANKVRRLVAVAGGGILLDRATGEMRVASPAYPAVYRPYAEEHRRIYERLQRTDLDWTLVCPTSMFDEPAVGAVRSEVDYVPVDGKRITYADVGRFTYAQLGDDSHLRQRVGIAE